MTRNPAIHWSKEEAELDFTALLKAVDKHGSQTIVHGGNVYKLLIEQHENATRRDVLDEPGPLSDEDHAIAFGSDDSSA